MEQPEFIARLKSRSPYSWLRERDIDLLLCAELHANVELQRLLLPADLRSRARFLTALVSHFDADGETDLLVVFTSPEGYVLILVEDKIDASFQPGQVERYQSRAARWRDDPDVHATRTVLLSPAGYAEVAEANGFDMALSYETVENLLRSETDLRSIFLADALAAGLAAYREGYVPVPDPLATSIWQRYWELAVDIAPQLRFARPGEKPANASFLSFSSALGFTGQTQRRVQLILKAAHGNADLQFSGLSVDDVTALTRDALEPDMQVVEAGKSASIRIHIPPVHFSHHSNGQEDAMRRGLLACERLRAMFVEHRIAARLMDTEFSADS